MKLSRCFYALTFFISIYSFFSYRSYVVETPIQFTWLSSFYSLFGKHLVQLFDFLIASLALSSFISLVQEKKILKIIAFVSLFLLIPLFYMSTGRFFHKFHTLLYCSFFFIFINPKSLKDSLSLQLARASILLPIAVSSLFKIKDIFVLNAAEAKGILSFVPISLIQNSIATQTGLTRLARITMEQSPFLWSIISLFILILEFSCFIPIILRKYYFSFGILIFLFHGLCSLTMNIFFFPSPVVALVVLSGPRILSFRAQKKSGILP